MTIKDLDTPSLKLAASPDTGKKKGNDADASSAGSLLAHIWSALGATLILGVICCGLYPLIVYGIGQVFFPVQANGSLIDKNGAYTTDDTKAVGSALIGQNFADPQDIYFHPRPSAAGAGYDATSSGGSNLGPLSDKLINGATATQPAATQTASTASAPADSQASSAPAVTETLAFDGIRLRCIHYAVDNGIAFKLYSLAYDSNANLQSKTEVPLSKYQDSSGNLLDTALVDAFPHGGTPTPNSTILIADDFATLIPGDAVTASGSGLDPHITPRNAQLQKSRVAAKRHMSEDAVQKLIDRYTDQPSLGIFGDPGVNVLRLNIALDQAAPVAPPIPATTTAPTTAK